MTKVCRPYIDCNQLIYFMLLTVGLASHCNPFCIRHCRSGIDIQRPRAQRYVKTLFHGKAIHHLV